MDECGGECELLTTSSYSSHTVSMSISTWCKGDSVRELVCYGAIDELESLKHRTGSTRQEVLLATFSSSSSQARHDEESDRASNHLLQLLGFWQFFLLLAIAAVAMILHPILERRHTLEQLQRVAARFELRIPARRGGSFGYDVVVDHYGGDDADG